MEPAQGEVWHVCIPLSQMVGGVNSLLSLSLQEGFALCRDAGKAPVGIADVSIPEAVPPPPGRGPLADPLLFWLKIALSQV